MTLESGGFLLCRNTQHGQHLIYNLSPLLSLLLSVRVDSALETPIIHIAFETNTQQLWSHDNYSLSQTAHSFVGVARAHPQDHIVN